VSHAVSGSHHAPADLLMVGAAFSIAGHRQAVRREVVRVGDMSARVINQKMNSSYWRRSTGFTRRFTPDSNPRMSIPLGRIRTVVLAAFIIIAMVNTWRFPALAQVSTQSASNVTPGFEVASVKVCKDDVPFDARTGGAAISSPETLDIECNTLKGLIQMAYVAFASGVRVTPDRVEIEGGPKWINSDRYTIKAKAPGVKSQMMMHGPMLQALLEDRFRVKVHHETRDVPVYMLNIAKGGPKLQAFKPGTCNVYDPAADFPPPPPPGNPCHNRGGMDNGVLMLDIPATTLDEFARFALGVMDRPVINKTGITGRFNFHLEYVPDETSSSGRVSATGATQVSGPSIFSAIEQLGLKLSPGKGPADHIVIDQAERPTGN
jgi:uncharacterized protein (TIGR03435 family)